MTAIGTICRPFKAVVGDSCLWGQMDAMGGHWDLLLWARGKVVVAAGGQVPANEKSWKRVRQNANLMVSQLVINRPRMYTQTAHGHLLTLTFDPKRGPPVMRHRLVVSSYGMYRRETGQCNGVPHCYSMMKK